MSELLVCFLSSLLLLSNVKCEMRLQITKNTDEFFTPVNDFVREKEGSIFSLICELIVSNENSVSLSDENLSWVKSETTANHTRIRNVVQSRPGINKSEKKFDPLQIQDIGNYYCISQKFNLSKTITIEVIDNIKRNEQRPYSYCNAHMFRCISNGLCIISHYVCDGKPDCKDGSDETIEKCNGDPCRDKILCDDGRCIPSSWCCDRHQDLNCTVTNRPKCCQSLLSESYEELEYGYPSMTHAQHNGARYLFISVCIVSILFSIVLLLLIVSKVVIFAKKTALQNQRPRYCENIPLHNQTDVNIIRANFSPTSIYSVGANSRTPRSNIIIEPSDISDPLLFNAVRFNLSAQGNYSDQPPSYVDAIRNKGAIVEPPPPYTSREILNVHEEGQERS